MDGGGGPFLTDARGGESPGRAERMSGGSGAFKPEVLPVFDRLSDEFVVESGQRALFTLHLKSFEFSSEAFGGP